MIGIRFLSVFICLILVLGGQCRLPRFPENLASQPEFAKYLDYLDEEDRIVGGEEAKIGQFKHQVSLQRKLSSGGSSHYCGASILNEHYIITAAHCVSGRKAAGITAFVGAIDLAGKTPNGPRGARYNVSRIISHESYDSSTVDNDIALLQVDGSIAFTESVQPIAILNQDARFPWATSCQVTGWGTQEEGGRVSSILRFVNVPLVSDETCKVNYNNQQITSSMICAGLAEGGKDSCQGDSGGPMVSRGVLVGIVSWGYGCARPGFPGVYTEVSHFTKWISSVTQPNIDFYALDVERR